jgi:hypothetical protein
VPMPMPAAMTAATAATTAILSDGRRPQKTPHPVTSVK